MLKELLSYPNARVMIVTDRNEKAKLLVDKFKLDRAARRGFLPNGAELIVKVVSNMDDRRYLMGMQVTNILYERCVGYGIEVIEFLRSRVRCTKEFTGITSFDPYTFEILLEEEI